MSQKWLKKDGYMLRGVWPALNSLSVHVTFTAIVPGAYPGPGESKMWLKTLIRSQVLLKTSHSRQIYRYISEMVEDRWVHASRRLTSIEFSFDPCSIYRDGPRGVGYLADARSVGDRLDSHLSCYNFCTVVNRRKRFTHTWQKFPPHLNNVLTLPSENENITFHTFVKEIAKRTLVRNPSPARTHSSCCCTMLLRAATRRRTPA